MNKSIAFHVGKIDCLVGVTRDMRGKRASMLADLAGAHTSQIRTPRRGASCCLSVSFFMI